jgi:WD40 repeat protein
LAVFDLRTLARVASISSALHDFKKDKTAWLDDQRVVTGSEEDGGIRVWNIERGTCESVSFMEGAVKVVSVIPDSNVIAAGDDAGNVQILSFER